LIRMYICDIKRSRRYSNHCNWKISTSIISWRNPAPFCLCLVTDTVFFKNETCNYCGHTASAVGDWNINKKHWWNDADKWKPKYSEKNASQWLFIHKISFLRCRASTGLIVRHNLRDWHHCYVCNFSITDNNVYDVRSCLHARPPHRNETHQLKIFIT
jgi:hypothetical protein